MRAEPAPALEIDLRLERPGFTLALAHRFEPRGVTALFGPSGGGKTTLLRAIAGLEPAARGRIALGAEVWLEGARAVPAHRRGVGMVFQDARLFAHLDVAGNLAYAARRAYPRAERSAAIAEAAAALDLGPLLGRATPTLSGGERQRVALARALLTRPRLMLLDEPLAALDRARKAEVLPYLEAALARAGAPAIYVSHSIDEVARLADRVVVLAEGALRAAGPTAQVLERLDLQTLVGRFEAGVLLEAVVRDHDAAFRLTRLDLDGQTLAMPMLGHLPAGERVRLRVRARDVAIATEPPRGLSIRNRLEGRIVRLVVEPETAFAEVFVDLGRQSLRARITRAAAAELGLAEGRAVIALVKSVTFDRRGLAGREPRGDDG